jgi:triacylglycerol esterase/lipase EstA (alpha/beta hydrolase family)
MRSVLSRTALAALAMAGLAATMLAAGPAAMAAARPSSGINDWSCQPSAQHPQPVILWHGLGGDMYEFSTLAPILASNGYCVFSETYGQTIFGPLVGGLAPMEDSAAQLASFVSQVKAATGAAKVDIVGHSEGSTVPAYYLKFLGGAAQVVHFVGFGANYHGTTLYGLATLANDLGLGGLLASGGCPACAEFLPGSAFLTKLDSGSVAVPGPTYTDIMTRYDEAVIPYTSGVLSGPNVTNIVIQDVCAADFSGHIGLAVDPNVAAMVLNALDPQHAKPVSCVPFADAGI